MILDPCEASHQDRVVHMSHRQFPDLHRCTVPYLQCASAGMCCNSPAQVIRCSGTKAAVLHRSCIGEHETSKKFAQCSISADQLPVSPQRSLSVAYTSTHQQALQSCLRSLQ